MPMKKRCKYCNKSYDITEDHMCEEKYQHMVKNQKALENKYKRERQRLYARSDDEGYKALHSSYWVKFRLHIIHADDGMCQRCYIKFHRYTFENLEVHHIKPRKDYPELAFDESNVVTLCRSCNATLGLSGLDFQWSPEDRKGQTFSTTL